MRVSGGRGQVLAKMLTEKGSDRGQALAVRLGGTSAGRGQSTPSPPVRRPEQRGRHADACTEASLPPPTPCIWTARVLQSLTLRLPPGHPRGWLPPPLNCQCMMCGLGLQLTRKKRRLLEPPLIGSGNRNKMRKPLLRNGKSASSAGSGNVMPGVSW